MQDHLVITPEAMYDVISAWGLRDTPDVNHRRICLWAWQDPSIALQGADLRVTWGSFVITPEAMYGVISAQALRGLPGFTIEGSVLVLSSLRRQ